MPTLARRGSLQRWLNDLHSVKVSLTVDGTALANSTTATSILDSANRIVIPTKVFEVGRVFRVQASGRISNIVTTPGTLTLDLRMTGASTVIVATSSAMQLNAVAKTNVTWLLNWLLTVRSIGSGTAATLFHSGFWHSESVVGSGLPSATGSGSLLIPASAPAVGTGFDSTVDQTLDLFATFSIANAGNSIQLHQFTIDTV